MDKRPHTDIHDIIENEVLQGINQFSIENKKQHDAILEKFDDLETLVINQHGPRVFMIIRDVAIVVLFIGMIIALKG